MNQFKESVPIRNYIQHKNHGAADGFELEPTAKTCGRRAFLIDAESTALSCLPMKCKKYYTCQSCGNMSNTLFTRSATVSFLRLLIACSRGNGQRYLL